MITGETLIIKTSADNVKSVTVDIYTKNNKNNFFHFNPSFMILIYILSNFPFHQKVDL